MDKSAQDALMNDWFTSDISVDSKSRLLQLAPSLGVANVGEAVAKIAGDLIKRATDEKVEPAQRVAAAKQLVVLQSEDDKIVETLLGSISLKRIRKQDWD